MLVVVPVEVIATGLAIVANVLIVVADWESTKVTLRELRTVLGRIVRVVAGVFLRVKVIKGSLVLEGSVKGRVFLQLPMGCNKGRKKGIEMSFGRTDS